MAQISVIVPVYNVEDYIEQCINSLLAQTFYDIEIIAVNDGSTDQSGRILDELKKKDQRLKVIHKENGGVTSARKCGLLHAETEYVGLVDGDDWISPDTYEYLYEIAIKNEVEAVFNQCCFKSYGDRTVNYGSSVEEGLYTYENKKLGELLQNIWNFQEGKPNIVSFSVLNLYKKQLFFSILEKIPEEVKFSEDTMCVYSYLTKVPSLYIVNKPLYYYRMRENSAANSQNERVLFDLNERYLFIKKYFEASPFAEILMKQLKYRKLQDMLTCRLFCDKPSSFYMFPYERIPGKTKIILYAAGMVGRSYYMQLKKNGYCEVVAWVDVRADELKQDDSRIEHPDVIPFREYAYILICVLRREVAENIKEEICMKYHVERQKVVIYTPQPIVNFIDI